jgi:hypothetical protein
MVVATALGLALKMNNASSIIKMVIIYPKMYRKLMTYFTQNCCYFTARSVNTTSTFVPLPLQCFQNASL